MNPYVRCLVPALALFASMPVHAQEAAHKLAPVLQPFVDGHSLAGAVVLVADRNKVLDLEAVGYADLAEKKPMAANSLFWIASQSKSMTAAAFMMLVDEGKVKLDDPVEKYLPEFKGQTLVGGAPPKHPITVRNVLSHTSGLPFSSGAEKPTLDGLPLKEGVKTYAAEHLQFEPDTKYQYSNAGINTAGRLIELLGGIPYEDFMDKRLFGPLGMKDTTFWPNAEQVARLAKPYKANKEKTGEEETTIGQLHYPLTERSRHPMPAGGLFSTAADVGRFCQMVLNGGEFQGKRLLSPEAVKAMTSRQTGKELKEGYGLGWSVGPNSFGHGGALSTNMNVDTKAGLITVFLVQQSAPFPNDGGKAEGAFRAAANRAFGTAK